MDGHAFALCAVRLSDADGEDAEEVREERDALLYPRREGREREEAVPELDELGKGNEGVVQRAVVVVLFTAVAVAITITPIPKAVTPKALTHTSNNITRRQTRHAQIRAQTLSALREHVLTRQHRTVNHQIALVQPPLERAQHQLGVANHVLVYKYLAVRQRAEREEVCRGGRVKEGRCVRGEAKQCLQVAACALAHAWQDRGEELTLQLDKELKRQQGETVVRLQSLQPPPQGGVAVFLGLQQRLQLQQQEEQVVCPNSARFLPVQKREESRAERAGDSFA